MIDASEVLLDPDFVEPFDVRRSTPGTFASGSEGVFQQGYQVLHLIGAIQPPGPDEAKRLKEGVRIDNIRCVWCVDEIKLGDGKTREADVLIFHGGNWRVFKVEDWRTNGYWLAFVEGIVT